MDIVLIVIGAGFAAASAFGLLAVAVRYGLGRTDTEEVGS